MAIQTRSIRSMTLDRVQRSHTCEWYRRTWQRLQRPQDSTWPRYREGPGMDTRSTPDCIVQCTITPSMTPRVVRAPTQRATPVDTTATAGDHVRCFRPGTEIMAPLQSHMQPTADADRRGVTIAEVKEEEEEQVKDEGALVVVATAASARTRPWPTPQSKDPPARRRLLPQPQDPSQIFPTRGHLSWNKPDDPFLKQRPLCRLWINGQKVVCFVDSGAQSCVVKSAVLRVLKNPEIHQVNFTLLGVVDDTEEKITKGLIAEIKLPDGKWFKQKVLVTSNPRAFPGILLIGSELLNRFNYKLISFSRPRECHFLSLDGHRIPVFFDPAVCMSHTVRTRRNVTTTDSRHQGATTAVPETHTVLLRASASFILMPYHGAFVTTYAMPEYTGTLLVTDVDQEVYVPAALYENQQCVLKIWVVNTTEGPINISQNSPIALAETGSTLSETLPPESMSVLESDGDAYIGDSYEAVQCGTLEVDPNPSEPEPTALPAEPAANEEYDLAHLTDDQARHIEGVIAKYTHLFDETAQLGQVPGIQHQIRMEAHEVPSRTKQWRLPDTSKAIIRQHCDDMILKGVVEPSSSPWLSPVVLVKKKDGKVRFCIDFRIVNTKTIMDAYPMPRIDELIDVLGGSKWFTTLDAKDAYWTIEMDPMDKAKTAFSDGYRLLQFTRMPFGLISAPSTFMRAINKVLSPVLGRFAIAYLDDVVVYSNTFDEHLTHLHETLTHMQAAGFRLNRKKCTLAAPEIKFLGFRINREGVAPEPEKVASIANMPAPTNVKGVRRFLGMTGFFRRHVPDYAQLAYPLNRLTRKEQKFLWGEKEQAAFDSLKRALCQAPVMRLPDFLKEFELHCDASGLAIGACLMQRDEEGRPHPIAYYSRKLRDAELNYPPIDSEALAVVESVRHFDAYIYGRHFTIYTDHQPLTSVLKRKCSSLRMTRWWNELLSYNYDLKYRQGAINHVPDALSRDIAVIDIMPDREDALTYERVGAAQALDPQWTQLRAFLAEGGPPPARAAGGALLDRFDMVDNCLTYHRWVDASQRYVMQIVIPAALRHEAIRRAHDEPAAGHQSHEKTYFRLRQLYYVPGGYTAVKDYCRRCQTCQEMKGQATVNTDLAHQPDPKEPFERVSADILVMNKALRRWSYILTIIDHFTRYTILIPLKEKTKEVVAEAIVNQLVGTFGPPSTIQMDHGSEFFNRDLQEICQTMGTRTHYTIVRRPQSNGMIERTHRVVRDMLKLLDRERHKDWPRYLPWVQLAMNTAWHRSIKNQPLYLLTGRSGYFTVGDTNVAAEEDPTPSRTQVEERRTYARSVAQEAMRAAREVWTQWYNSERAKVPRKEFHLGDIVLRLCRLGGASGVSYVFSKKWDGPWRVTEVKGPKAYEIRELHTPRVMTVHTSDLKIFHPPVDFVWPDQDHVPRDPGDNDEDDREAADDPEAEEAPEDQDGDDNTVEETDEEDVPSRGSSPARQDPSQDASQDTLEDQEEPVEVPALDELADARRDAAADDAVPSTSTAPVGPAPRAKRGRRYNPSTGRLRAEFPSDRSLRSGPVRPASDSEDD